MPTVGIDYTAAVHQTAGIGRYTFELVRTLARLVNGLEAIDYRLFVAGAGRDFKPAPLGRPFHWCPTRLTERWLGRLWYRLQLPLWIETWTGPLDLFHAPDFFLPPVRARTRTIVTVHDLSFVRLPETTMVGMERQLNTWVPLSVQRAGHVIAVSEATRQDLIELYQTPPEKITTLYHGVAESFRPVRDKAHLTAVRQKYRLGEDPFLLSVGTIQPRKNYRRLIQAFARLDPALSLVIVGSKGWHTGEILAEVTRRRLDGRVKFLGFVADADLPALYSAASLFVYPSLYEGFGLPVLEAMACGTPVVASNVSALPEVAGQAGLLVDPYDVAALATALGRVIEDPDLHQFLAQAGLVQAQKFRWEETGQKLLGLYQRLLEEA